MENRKPYMMLKCETVQLTDGQTETVFSGSTKNSDNNGSTEFSGVIAQDDSVKGSYKEKAGDHIELLANTDGTGFSEIPTVGLRQPSLAQIAKEALKGPAKACNPRLLPWAPAG